MAASSEEALRVEDVEPSPLDLPEPMLQDEGTTDDLELAAYCATVAVTDFASPSTSQRLPMNTKPTQPSPKPKRIRPGLERNSSSFSSISSYFKHPFSHIKGRNKSFRGSNSSSSKSASTISSPEIQAMIKGKVVPDLHAVNKALEAANGSLDDSEGGKLTCAKELNAIAAGIEAAHRDGKKLLVEAMQARSAGKPEICRAKCIQIIHSPFAEVEMKVYASNVLSTQASVGQAEHFLDKSVALVEGSTHDEAEKDQMLAVVAMLRASAKTRVGTTRTTSNAEEAADHQKSEDWLHRGGREWHRGVVADAAKKGNAHLGPPDSTTMNDVSTTPRTDKILKWAGEGRKKGTLGHARTNEEILCTCGTPGKGRMCLVHWA
ncbi:uncharacterized protein LTR77_003570 [Saxophila tyrrhenica]|uniref:Uncharacterized protein n=1 Tax=Saxophila tyrrhenica TaxID=1690608 RepID=A0AAV9PE45_9PEZI|nr:hypothetical protein LTR77_003570 [Saxophila tyrrhenica]